MTSATLPSLLAERAATDGARCLLRFAEGDHGVAEVAEASARFAGGLTRLGLAQGDTVAMLVGNRSEFVTAWFGAVHAGAIAAPINTAFRGRGLADALATTGAPVVVVDADHLEQLATVTDALRPEATIVVIGQAAPDDVGQRPVVPFAQVADADAVPAAEAHPRDAAMLLFTSGTTGRSKACILSHRYLVRHSAIFAQQLGLRREDVLYCPYPLFHIDAAVLTVLPALHLGATAALGAQFSVSRFWDEVRAMGATVFDFMGATLTLLNQARTTALDRDHRVRLAWGVPLPAVASEFTDRFGVDLIELYGSTDAGVVLYPPAEGAPAGSCGRTIGTYTTAVVDDDGTPLPPGTIGELVLRPEEPGLLADGYWADAEATVASRRDLWFHTGDLVRTDEAGNVWFVARRGDVIRRRGENIAAAEVEEALAEHPGVAEVAVVGVASDLTEQDVLAAVVSRPDATVDPADLIRFCAERVARHMVPRYVRIVDALPKTPTSKVERHVLAAAGVTGDTWDAGDRPAGRVS